jgi:hypothetical protein
MATFLNDVWSFYYHRPESSQWDESSYVFLGNVGTMEEFFETFHTFKDYLAKGMFFLMREHVRPMWEDDHNKNGGCFSFKVMKPEVADHWLRNASAILGEVVVGTNQRARLWNQVNGISVLPKRSYCIMRVWLADTQSNVPNAFQMMAPSYSKLMFKPHQENKHYLTANS